MSLDRSLKSRDALTRHRNVLKRVERLEKLADEELWSEDKDSVFGLPKVANRKLAAAKKTKKVKDAEEDTAETTEATESAE